ncbi:hypothetical protein ABZW30_44750 [Kitasatospora sp. NPDC004669]|uniref:hypothetical protein n=1 Tax=Kitasatospora sp. NPDC004669 TaxID=3154555 RepID=UPI0033BABAB7
MGVLLGCSSMKSTPEPGHNTETGTDTGAATAASSTGSGGSTGSTGTGGGGAGGGSKASSSGSGGGGFNTAGRLSDNFSGTWPDDLHLNVDNSSATAAFVGTVSVADCTDDKHTQKATPPSQPVNVPPKGSQALDFNFNPDTEKQPISTHTVCVKLNDQQGHLIDQRKTPVTDTSAPTGPAGNSPSPTP